MICTLPLARHAILEVGASRRRVDITPSRSSSREGCGETYLCCVLTVARREPIAPPSLKLQLNLLSAVQRDEQAGNLLLLQSYIVLITQPHTLPLISFDPHLDPLSSSSFNLGLLHRPLSTLFSYHLLLISSWALCVMNNLNDSSPHHPSYTSTSIRSSHTRFICHLDSLPTVSIAILFCPEMYHRDAPSIDIQCPHCSLYILLQMYGSLFVGYFTYTITYTTHCLLFLPWSLKYLKEVHQ